MSVTLPTSPGPRAIKAHLRDFGGILSPQLGGPDQKLNRLGNRFSIDFDMPSMWTEPDGRIWVSRLGRGQTAGVTMLVPQPNLVIGTPGSILVNGASQSGTTLAVDGGTAGYVIREGQFFTIVTGGRGYLHAAASALTLNGSGAGTLSIWPMLRTAPADNSVCNFSAPYIEGFLSGNDMPWDMPLEPITNISFTITEAE